MNKEILEKMGFEKEVQRVDRGKCPICDKKIIESDFRDYLSKKEFRISGMCQSCQDKVFGM